MSKGFFTVIYGDEYFLLDRARDHLYGTKGYSVVRLDGETLTGSGLVAIITGQYLDSDTQLFVLDNAGDLQKSDPFKKYVEGLKDPSSTNSRMACIVRGAELPALWDLVAQKGSRKQFAKPSPWKISEQVTVLRGELARLGLKAEPNLLNGLIQQVGWNLGLYVREFEKLMWLLGPGGQVTGEAIKVTSFQKQAEPWHITDAIALRQRGRAMNLLSALCKAQGESSLVPVVVTAMRQFEKLAIVKSLQEQGASEDAMAKRVDMHPFRFQQTLAVMAPRYTKAEISKALQILCRLDLLVKGSALSKRTHVELAILKIAS